MDALLAFGVNWKLLIIQGVNFGLLLLVLYRFLYKPLFSLLEKRQRLIAKGLEDARRVAEEMDKVAKEKVALLASAREEGGKLVEQLRKEAVREEKKIVQEAQQRSAALLLEARAKAKDEREHILRESEKEIARMAILGAEKILRG